MNNANRKLKPIRLGESSALLEQGDSLDSFRIEYDKEATLKQKVWARVSYYVPILSWLPNYKKEYLIPDLIAGKQFGSISNRMACIEVFFFHRTCRNFCCRHDCSTSTSVLYFGWFTSNLWFIYVFYSGYCISDFRNFSAHLHRT